MGTTRSKNNSRCYIFVVAVIILNLFSHIVCQKPFRNSFSCIGRAAGYYADIDAGCQLYHMCDGLGRQFTYSCPNTTLFQQRMLICDHWYMVNCSKSESYYEANLLIGQKDKPFVPDEEIHFRTPRPDLLDRPYSFDYLGDSFRSEYKNSGSENNQIIDTEKKFDEKLEVSGTRWRLPLPITSTYRPQNHQTNDKKAVARVSQIPLSAFEVRTTPSPKSKNTNRRLGNEIQSNSIDDDLSFGLSSYYNSSHISQEIKQPSKIKIPSRVYEAPPLFPIYNKDYKSTVPTSTSTPFTVTRPSTIQTTTFEPIKITPNAGKPFTPSGLGRGSNFASNSLRVNDFSKSTDFKRTSTRTAASITFGRTSTKTNPSTTAVPKTSIKKAVSRQLNSFSSNTNPTRSTKITRFNEALIDIPRVEELISPSPFKINVPSIPEPEKILLPPFKTLTEHNVATTQGPPIYFEWKIPSDGLEPPKFNSPIVARGRIAAEPFSINSINSDLSSSTTIKSNKIISAPITTKNQRAVKPTTTKTTTTQRSPSPTPRSIKDLSNEIHFSHNPAATDEEFLKLRKDFSVPEYIFPLETNGRTGYDHLNSLNSFQLEIPKEKVEKGEIETRKTWFGENPKCPECHPTFLKPGTCEPCIRSR